MTISYRINDLIKTLSPAKQANEVKALLFLASLASFFCSLKVACVDLE